MGIAQYDVKKVINTLKSNTDNSKDNTRKTYFESIGVNVQNASSLETAIKLSGLDFEVQKFPISFNVPTPSDWNNKQIIVDVPHKFPGQFATVRTDTMEPLGVVGKNYEICQNIEAFDFLDSLVGDAKFETAGLYGGNGAKSFITMSTEPMKILGDDFKPYILFTNSFDGTGSVRVMFTPIRVFCSNCLVRAMKAADHKLSIRHSSNLKVRMENAKHILLENTKYLDALKIEAEKLAVTPFSEDAFTALAKSLFPVNEEDSNRIQVNNMEMFEELMRAYKQSDLDNFKNSAWRAVQAVSDFESHKPTHRQTETSAYKDIKVVMANMPLLNQVTNMLMANVA